MTGSAGHSSSTHDLSARAVASYARAVARFTRPRAPHLPARSFARISGVGRSGLPALEHYTAPDGAALPFRLYPGRGSGTVMILVHGSAGFGDQFHVLARELSTAGVAHVYTLDLRGHGAAPGLPGHGVTYPHQLVDDLAAFTLFARARHPSARIVLCGHSAGGGLALGVARTQAAKELAGYVLLAPFLGVGSHANRAHFGGWVKVAKLKLYALGALNLLGIRALNGAPVVRFNVGAVGDDRYVKAWSLNTMLAFGPGYSTEDLTIPPSTPVLVLAGETDDCFDPAAYPEALRNIAGHAAIEQLPSLSHWDILVEDGVQLRIAGWLADHSLGEMVRTAGGRRKRPAPADEAGRRARAG